MKKEIAGKWIEALRSGKYTQGKNFLNKNNKYFCCFGVLCELALSEGLHIPKVPESYSSNCEKSLIYKYDYNIQFLPVSVKKWAGINTSDPALAEEMISMNDQNSSFDKIADFIHANQEII